MHHPEGNENPGGPKPTALIEAQLEAARIGFLRTMTKQGAAQAMGVHRGTLATWEQIGRRDRAAGQADDATPAQRIPSLHWRLVETLEAAKDELVAELAAQVQARAIADGDTKTLLRILAQLDPDTWAEKKEVRHGGVEGAPPIRVDAPPAMQTVFLSFDADLAAEAEALARGDE